MSYHLAIKTLPIWDHRNLGSFFEVKYPSMPFEDLDHWTQNDKGKSQEWHI